MNYESILVHRPTGSTFQITLNRPRRLNALNRQTILELRRALAEFVEGNEEFLILCGSGRAFCFGADFQEFQNRESLPGLLSLFQELILELHDLPKISIAVLNGFATGAGLDLALACDFRIAAEKIKIGEAYISMGLVPDGGGTHFLPGLIGSGRALEMLLTGEAISAEDAKSLGLIHRVFPSTELMKSVRKFVEDLAQKPKTARSLIKRLIKNPSAGLKDALLEEQKAQLICFDDPDHLRLAEEFLKKRKKED